jgi:hypothetical protein
MDMVAIPIWPYLLGIVLLIGLVLWLFERNRGGRP